MLRQINEDMRVEKTEEPQDDFYKRTFSSVHEYLREEEMYLRESIYGYQNTESKMDNEILKNLHMYKETTLGEWDDDDFPF